MEKQSDRFLRDATVTLMVSFILMGVLSLGLSPSLSSVFVYPINLIVSGLIILFSLLGIHGIMFGNNFGVYFASLTSVWEVILGGFLIVQQKLLIQGLTSMTLGLASSLLTFRLYQSLDKNLQLASQSFTNEGSSSSEYAVELIDLEKKYFAGSMAVPAVNGINLKIKRGEFVSIMGPSGCGKSTLLNVIGALDKPTVGKVLIDGVDISTLGSKPLARLRNEKVGFVFQAYNLINRSTVFRNVELPTLVKGLPRDERARRVKEMLDVVGLPDKAYRRPKMLSGGEQQRVAIARALINKPSIILADEPTGNLDSKAGGNIISFLRKLNEETGTTIIVVTHNKEVADVTDRVIHLRDGRILKEEKKARRPE